MKNNYFYSKFQKKRVEELRSILNDPKSYTDDAVLAAIQLLKEREVTLSKKQMNVEKKIEANKEKSKEIKREIRNQSELSQFPKRVIAFVTILGAINKKAFWVSLFYVSLGGLVICSMYPGDPLNGEWFDYGFFLTYPVSILGFAMRYSDRTSNNTTNSYDITLIF